MSVQISETSEFVKRFHRISSFSLGVILAAQGLRAGIESEFVQWARGIERQSQIRQQEELNERGKCIGMLSEESEIDLPERVMCFVSFSMSIENLVDLSKQLEKVGGVFVLRGIPDEGMAFLGEKISQIRRKGGRIPFLIDPKAFQTFGIVQVPSFVVYDGKKYDKVTGNISVDHVKRLFDGKGDVGVKFSEEEDL